MSNRDRDGVPGVVKLGLGVGVGFALYMMFGGRGGLGFGRGATAPGSGVLAEPPRPPDTQPVVIRVRPSLTDPAMAVIEMEGSIVTVGDLVARIQAGGRRDVVVIVRGDTRQGAADEIEQAIVAAGFEIIRRPP